MLGTSVASYPLVITANKPFPAYSRPVHLSSEKDQLKFEQATLALRNIHRQTNISKATIQQCPSCDFQTTGTMTVHEKHHVKKWSQQCHLCSYSAGTKQQLTFHLHYHHLSQTEEAVGEPLDSPPKKNLQCSQCDYQTVDYESLNWHIQMQHQIVMKPAPNEHLTKRKSTDLSLYRCQHCDFTTQYESSLRKHIKHHLNSFALQCPKCSYSVDKTIPLTRHIRFHHRGNLEPNSSTEKEIHVNKKQHYRQVLSTKKESTMARFQCEQCEYKTDEKWNYDGHRKFHTNKSVHQCPKCSYSVGSITHLTRHVTHYHRSDLKPNFSTNDIKKQHRHLQVSSSEKKVVARYPCELCGYKSNTKANFLRHSKFHMNISSHQCDHCSYSVNGARRLIFHLENHHSGLSQVVSEPLLPVLPCQEPTRNERKRVKRYHENTESTTNEKRIIADGSPHLFKCKQCNFFTSNYAKLNAHKECHEKNLKLKCPLCSFSSNLNYVLTFHVNNHHGDDSELISSEHKKVERSTTTMDDLVPDFKPPKPSRFGGEETRCREQLSQLEEAVQSDHQSLKDSSNKLVEQEKKMESVRTRIEIMKENLQIAETKMKDVLLRLGELGKQKRKTLKRKMEAEFELRVQQYKALELDLIAADAVEEDHKERVSSVEKEVKSLKDELGEIDKELDVLEEEEETLTEDLEYAEEFPKIGASRWLPMMQRELEELKSGWQVETSSLNKMVESSKDRIQACDQLEGRLMKIGLLKELADLRQKKSSLMLSLCQLELDHYAANLYGTDAIIKSSFLYAVGLLPVLNRPLDADQ